MANKIRTIDFLPEIFRTAANQQFLSSTLDQLIQEPKLKATEGYIGKKSGPGVLVSDVYINEPTAIRNNYQLDPGVVFLKANTNTVDDAITYPGIIDKLSTSGATTFKQNRLFESEYYSWDPFIDFDKFVNFGQYYWLPSGPDSVDVYASDVASIDNFDVTRSTQGYSFSGVEGNLPTVILVRDGNYTFDVNQTGNPFWIQSTPGTSGTLPFNEQSNREILGVVNNGEDLGTITFNVPSKTAQNFYLELESAGNVDLVTDLQFNQINNIFLDQFINEHGGIDGISDLKNKTIVFLNNIPGEDGGWISTTQFDSVGTGYDTLAFDQSTIIENNSEKYSVWQINIVTDGNDENAYIKLSSIRSIDNLNKINIQFGNQYASTQFYKNAEGYFEKIPLITANADILYYQDQNNPDYFGVIKLVDQSGEQVIDIDEILSSSEYTSYNGVEFTNGLKVKFQAETSPASYRGNEYFVEGVGSQIKLMSVEDFLTPETYTENATVPYDSVAYDVGGYDDTLNSPLNPDYFTINRASIDNNAWSRSNRWFHIDVINKTADYNNNVVVLDNNYRAKRPIIEFKPNLKLFNHGIQAVDPVNIIDFSATDAFSNINGTSGYSVDGYSFVNGTKVIFANDTDPAVRNKIYTVNFAQYNEGANPVIDLQPADITKPGVLFNQSVLITNGVENQGRSFVYNGTEWVLSQQKTSVNQEPLFDIFDENDISFSDQTVYPGSNFVGTKLFSYATGAGPEDPVLQKRLKYLTIGNVGDIVFDNNLYSDSFVYTIDAVTTTKNISEGTVRQYSDRLNYQKLIGWQTAWNTIVSRQILNFEYTGSNLVLDVEVLTELEDIPIKVYANGDYVLPSAYSYSTNSDNVTEIVFNDAPAIGSFIEVSFLSDTVSGNGYYSIPSNLENNSINENSNELTLGTIRNHYSSICENLQFFTGKINGSNNLRDLGNVVPYGDRIVQHSSPITLLATFMHNKDLNFFRAIDYAALEYEKFKTLLLEDVANNEWPTETASQILEESLARINQGKNKNSPFYWTDMIPSGELYTETSYTITAISTSVFDTVETYDFTSANYKGILVYLNDVQLIGNGFEYTISTDGPRIIIHNELTPGDVVKIKEYTATYNSFVPATPTSMGMAQAFRPEIFLDYSYSTPQNVILGHDGSKTIAFNDIRDQVLLEFEKRVYNNIKVQNRTAPPVHHTEVVPGQFRTTSYTESEITQLLSSDFLSWVGQNKLDYKEQIYDQNNPFTWNYSSCKNKLDGKVLLGNWRGIYNSLYDTDSPNTRPWVMLGLTEKPLWWDSVYGPAPYTSGNLVLWEDLRDGRVADPDGSYVVEKFKRPDLLDIIPVDSEGNLLPPFDVVVGEYDQNSFRKSWVIGDIGPVENAWRRSSRFVFARQKLIALSQPAKYFGLFVDLDQYNFDQGIGQYLFDNRYRIRESSISVYGAGTSKNSYINWVVDYNDLLGRDSTEQIESILNNIDVRLIYRVAGFTDKQYLKIYTEKSSPNSLNSSLLLPDESYQLLLYKNPTIEEIIYSSVIIQKTNNGYAVFGYSTTTPYFEILTSVISGKFSEIEVNGETVRIPQTFSSNITRIPYGYEFTTVNGVIDFLISYGKRLENQGLVFDNTENNIVLDWTQMGEEFLYWSQQGWISGSIINLNPAADVIKIEKQDTIIDSLTDDLLGNNLLNQNKRPISDNDYAVERIDNTLKIRSLNGNTISFLKAEVTAYEHTIVFDNTSIFNDLLYSPSTGLRQSRLLFKGYTTYDWKGKLDAQGFILNSANVNEWQPNTGYSKGELVIYKNDYWSAAEILPPKTEFDFSDWIKSDYDSVQKGLLPNLATKSDLLRNYYDTNNANLERDADLLGFGLIGFRPRQYMQNLNLDDISQVNLYRSFIGSKGTMQSAGAFSQASLNKEFADYEIYENWAIKRALYGANANRNYIELRTNQSNLSGNPSTISIVRPSDQSYADQTILLENVWKQSVKFTNTNILPVNNDYINDFELPTAGFVNYDDVDIKVFELNDITSALSDLENVDEGTNIWVAKSNSHDWNIYRTNNLGINVIQVTDNLNGRSTITFDREHNLQVNDYLVIKYFDELVNGAYQVLSVNGIKTVTVELNLPDNVTSIQGFGVPYTLESVKVNQSSDIADLSFANQLLTTNKVWVKDNGAGKWATYEKTNPFSDAINISVDLSDETLDSQFGSSIAQGLLGQGAIIGAPGGSDGSGSLYVYNKSTPTSYVNVNTLSLDTTNLIGLGASLDAGASEWAASGAPESENNRGYVVVVTRVPENGNYRITQILVEDSTQVGSQFGKSIAISDDERWMFVGAPGDDTVFAYYKNVVEEQKVNFVGDFTTNIFDISDHILVNSTNTTIGQTQLGVTVNDRPQTAGVDWLFNGTSVVFTTPPNTGDKIRVIRKQSATFFPTTPTATFDLSTIYTVETIDSSDAIYSFSVYVDGILQRPGNDYTYNHTTKELELTSATTETVLVTSQTHWSLIDSYNYKSITDDSSTNPKFGYSLSCTTDGRQLIAGSPDDDPDFIEFAGSVQLVDRSVERVIITDTSEIQYTTTTDIQGTPAVKINNRFLNYSATSVNNEYSFAGNTVTLSSDLNINVGDILEIETNQFRLMQSISSRNKSYNYNFGKSVSQCGTNCSLYIGMPNDSVDAPQSGSVDRWVNQARLYGVISSTIASPVLTPGDTIRINNYHVTLTGTDVQSLKDDIDNADIPNVQASVSQGILTLALANASAADQFIKIQVLPGEGEAYYELGFEPMAYTQTVRPPVAINYGHFGESVDIDVEADTLIVGAPDSASIAITTFDQNTTLFDGRSTKVQDILERTGAVFTYDFLLSANGNVNNPAKFVFGQQLYNENIQTIDRYGSAVNYKNGILLIGAPQNDLGDSSGNYGTVSQYNNTDKDASWQQVYTEQPIVDSRLLNSVFVYNKLDNQVIRYLDYIDPAKGKILGVARQNIDYITSADPAQYNNGNINNTGQVWTEEKVGEYWWNIENLRFIEYHQDSIEYQAKRWGQLFPGSTVDVYQWIESTVPPGEYAGEGQVYSTTSYSVSSVLNADGLFSTRYFYWVKGITSIVPNKQKTLSVNAVEQYISNPKSSGIPYIAPLSANSVSLYNCEELLQAKDIILHIEFDKEFNNDNVHAEFDLIASGKADSFLSNGLYRKLLDSFCGEDTVGNLVPDVALTIADKYGINYRPRQSFFKDRFLALENYIERANSILAQFPIVESKNLNLLFSSEPEPTSVSGEWDKKLNSYAELTYQNLDLVSTGYKYLVASDSNNSGLWTIYTVQSNKTLMLTRVQNYDTSKFWEYADWVLPGYDITTKTVNEVPTYNDLVTLTVDEGDSVKVTSNSFGKYEIYQYLNGSWTRVVAEDSTVKISSTVYDFNQGKYGFDIETFDSQRFDQNPNIETRQILKSLNEEIFIDDLSIYKNQLLILVFDFILSEQISPDWLVKTSLIDVSHTIRELKPFRVFKQDNQDFVQDYINEVKPFRTKIKEFNLRYEGSDLFRGTLVDFDVPSYYNESLQKFISPIIDDAEKDPSKNTDSVSTSNDTIWQTFPYNQWFNNYKLSLIDVTVIEEGEGFLVPPQVSVVGDADVPAELQARISTAGKLIGIDVLVPGEGYITTPEIVISGGNGTGAKAVPVMQNLQVRSFDTTIKFDRCEYTSGIQEWQTNTYYEEGSLVRYQNRVYSINNVEDSTALDSGDEFDPSKYTLVDQSTLSGADRTIGYYNPDVSDPGRELALLITGVKYPGVQITGPQFNQNTGYDVSNFDVSPYDNFDLGPEGFPTYSQEILDAVYESSFTDTLLGTRSTDINVDGGNFIDTYSSHAPEELIPGSTFDTLDMKVRTRIGSDHTGSGWGFPISSKNAEFVAGGVTISFDTTATAVSVENDITGQVLDAINHFTVDWPNSTITVYAGAQVGDVLNVRSFGVGGGNQLYKETITNFQNPRSVFTVTVNVDEIYDILIKVNGFILSSASYTYSANENGYDTDITLDTPVTSNDRITIVVLGETESGATWSTPQGEYFVYDGSTTTFSLSESLQGTNPVDIIVYQNGYRLRPAESVEYFSDGSSLGPYYLPNLGGTNQGLISDNEVIVYVDDVKQDFLVDYTLTPWDGSSDRYIAFTAQPPANARIKIAVTTNAAYQINVDDSTLILKRTPIIGSVITVVTFNDTSEQLLLTSVFQGPTTEGITVKEQFDTEPFDSAAVNATSGSYDFTLGTEIQTNNFDIGRQISSNERLEVTLNGKRLVSDLDFSVSGSVITLGRSLLSPDDILVITSFTQNVVSPELNFVIFQDMLGNQTIRRLNKTNGLSRPLAKSDDIIYLYDASNFQEPNLSAGIFGVAEVDSEHITYRVRDLENNTLSGLRRGVSGTAAADHALDTTVYNAGIGEILPAEYQKQELSDSFLGDGSTTTFVAENVTIGELLDSTEIEEVVRVNVGGRVLSTSEYTVTQLNPYAEVTLIDAPAAGVIVKVYIVKSNIMYEVQSATITNGLPLQLQNTDAVAFLKGII